MSRWSSRPASPSRSPGTNRCRSIAARQPDFTAHVLSAADRARGPFDADRILARCYHEDVGRRAPERAGIAQVVVDRCAGFTCAGSGRRHTQVPAAQRAPRLQPNTPVHTLRQGHGLHHRFAPEHQHRQQRHGHDDAQPPLPPLCHVLKQLLPAVDGPGCQRFFQCIESRRSRFVIKLGDDDILGDSGRAGLSVCQLHLRCSRASPSALASGSAPAVKSLPCRLRRPAPCPAPVQACPAAARLCGLR